MAEGCHQQLVCAFGPGESLLYLPGGACPEPVCAADGGGPVFRHVRGCTAGNPVFPGSGLLCVGTYAVSGGLLFSGAARQEGLSVFSSRCAAFPVPDHRNALDPDRRRCNEKAADGLRADHFHHGGQGGIQPAGKTDGFPLADHAGRGAVCIFGYGPGGGHVWPEQPPDLDPLLLCLLVGPESSGPFPVPFCQ